MKTDNVTVMAIHTALQMATETIRRGGGGLPPETEKLQKEFASHYKAIVDAINANTIHQGTTHPEASSE